MYSIEDKRSPCDVYRLWPNADKIIQKPTNTYAIVSGGPGGLDVRSSVWAVCGDPLRVPGCVVCLCVFAGEPVTVRYGTRNLRRVNYGKERFEQFLEGDWK